VIPPAAPTGMSAAHGSSVFFLVLCSVIFAAFFGWCVVRAVRTRQPIALFLLLGGLIATLVEPMLDNLGLLWFDRNNVGIAFHLFGRYMPTYVVLGYGFFFGGMAFVAYDGLRRGHGVSFLWKLYAVGWVFDMAIESGGSLAHLYKYYGTQPFNIWGVPLWWMFINPALCVAVGVVCYRLGDRMAGMRSVLAVPLLPLMYGGIYGGACWPIFVALHSTRNLGWLYIAGIASDAFALMVVWLATLMVPVDAAAGEAKSPVAQGVSSRASAPRVAAV
jgi:hypothetical protein